ncbi:MAG: hypothetical protein RL885_32540 [Planctomycetota bacterium]
MKKKAATLSRRAAARVLASCYRRNGHARWQDPERVRKEGPRRYKKGDEVRLFVSSPGELQTIQQCLEILEFQPGKPFQKRSQICLPLYGWDAVSRFLDLVESIP